MAIPFNDSVDLKQNELLNVTLQNLAADPVTGLQDGRIYYDTVLDAIRAVVGGSIVSLQTGSLDAEGIQDIVGAMLSGNTETGITVTYQDSDGTIDFAVTDSPLLGGQNSAYHLARANHTGTQLFSTVVTSNTDKLLGRDTAAGGAVEEIAVSGGIEFTGSAGIQTSAFTGDVTKSAGGTALSIAANAVVTAKIADANVTLAKMADLAQSTFIGRAAGAGTGVPTALTVAQVKTALAYNGTEVVFTPAGNIAATNVSAAISELETDLTALITQTIEARTWKDPVDAATTGVLPNTPTYSAGAGTLTAGSNTTLAAQDGVTLAVGDDLLVKDQASSFQDGVYTLTAAGSGAAPWVLTRRADCSTAAELRDATVIVQGGTANAGDVYTQTVSTLADLTSATQTWAKTGEGNTTYTADGTTIELVGNSFRIAASAAGNGLTGGGGAALAVNPDGTTLEISSDAVRIAAGAAGAGLTGGGGSALAVGQGTGIVVNANDIAVDRTTGAGRVPLVYAAAITGGATSEVITHNLGTRDVHVLIYLSSGTFAEELFSIEHTSTTTVTIRSAATIPGSTYRVVILG